MTKTESTSVRRRAARLSATLETYRNDSRWQQWVLVGIAVLAALGVRFYLLPVGNNDITGFYIPWFEYLKQHGFPGLGKEFANYNPPYLYLLYLGSLTSLKSVIVIKGISLFFDIVLFAGVVAIVYHFRRSAMLAVVSGAATLLLPEVFLNSGMWGQTDSLYVSMLVWSAYFVVSRRDIGAWVLFGLAFSFKLQALFLLPMIMLAFLIQRQRWRAPAIGLLTFFAMWIPSIVAGRSVPSLINIYLDQANGPPPHLANFVANMYQWVPNTLYDTVSRAGLCFALAIVALLVFLYLRRARSLERPELFLLQAGAAIAVVVPFVLPQMHDRYFYAAGVFTFVCALFMKEYIVPAILLQFTAVITYSTALFQVPPAVPLQILAILQLAVVAWIVALSLLRTHSTVPAIYLARALD